MKDVRLVHLRLSGFGRFGGSVHVGLEPGLNLVAAPNESGKSTLVAGLSACLFGLPGGGEAAGAGISRLRNVHGPSHFGGELEISVGSILYRIERSFDAGTARLLRQHRGRWELLAASGQGAAARGGAAQVDRALVGLLGLGSREVLDATFCLQQPLPETTGVDTSVQQMLVAAGSDAVGRALATLHARGCSASGVPESEPASELGRTMKVLMARHDELERGIQASLARVDAIEPTRARLIQASKEHAAAAAEAAAHRSLLAALTAWRENSQALVAAQRDAASLGATLAKAEAAERAVIEHRAAIETTLADVAAAPRSLEQHLSELGAIEEELAVLEEEGESIARRVHEAEAQAHGLGGLIATRFGAIAGKPRVLADLSALLESRTSLASLESALASASAQEARLGPEVERLRACKGLGPTPLATFDALHQHSLESTARWREIAQMRTRIESLTQALASGPGALFAAAPDTLRSTLRSLESEERRLDADVAAAESRLAAALARLDELSAQARALDTQYADIAQFPDERVIDIQRRIALLKDQAHWRGLAQIASREDARTRVRRQITALVGLLVGLQGGVALAQEGWLMLVLGVLGCFPAMSLTWTITGRVLGVDGPVLDPAPIAGHLAQIRDELAEIDPRLGTLARGDLSACETIRLRIIQRQKDRAGLEQRRAVLADASAIAGLQADLTRARQERETLLTTVTPIRAACAGSISAAFLQWERLAQEKCSLQSAVGEWATSEFAVAPERVSAHPVSALTGRWRDLAIFARLLGRTPGNVRELVTQLQSLKVADWARARGQVEQFEQVHSDLAQARQTLEDSKLHARRGALRAQIAHLAEALRPVPETISREQLARSIEELRTVQSRHKQVLADLARDREALARIGQKVGARRRAADSRREALGPWLDRSQGSVAGVRERLAQLAQARAGLGAAQQCLAGLLGALDLDSVETLRRRRGDAHARAAGARHALDAQLERTPSLTTLLTGTDPVMDENRFVGLNASVVATESRAALAKVQVEELQATLAHLSEMDTLNIAAARREQATIARAMNRQVCRAQALAIAHEELSAALADYRLTYRGELTRAATEHLTAITGVPGRRAVIDEAFRVSVQEPDGSLLCAEQLSLGARDQLTLAVRLAIADLLAGDVRWPLVLDDPVASWDSDRIDRLRSALQSAATDRQVLLLTHRQDCVTWGHAVQLEEEKAASAA